MYFIVEVLTKSSNILLGSIYRPPNTNGKLFNKEIESIMGIIKLETHNDVVIGLDHNLDFLKSEKHSETSHFISTVLENSLLPCITRPTRVTHSSATLIDNTLMSCNLAMSQCSTVIVHDISDHFPSLTTLEGVKLKKQEKSKIKSHKLDDCAINAITSNLSNIDWPHVFGNQSMDDSYNGVINLLTEKLDEFAPTREVIISDKQVLM